MNRPNITLAEARQMILTAPQNIYAALKKYADAGRISEKEAADYCAMATIPENKPVMVLAIRGYYKKTMANPEENDRGIYDDAIMLIGPNYFQSFNGNTDPRVHEKGKAMLLPGWHSFKQGWHGYGKPSGHKAFRTANVSEIAPVLRDGQTGIKEGITINLHSGGFNNTNSAGCQTIYKGQWDEFQKEAYRLMNAEGQKELPYLLIENI